MNDETRRHVVLALARLYDAEQAIEAAIDRIPTGSIRNAVTEANIHVMSAYDKLREANRIALLNLQQGKHEGTDHDR